jgi:hypothetical protein
VKTFRKKPVEVEAVQFTGDNADEIQVWSYNHVLPIREMHSPIVLAVPTLEGVMKASVGDWIVRGVADEYYPCKPDIFEQTYEPVG